MHVRLPAVLLLLMVSGTGQALLVIPTTGPQVDPVDPVPPPLAVAPVGTPSLAPSPPDGAPDLLVSVRGRIVDEETLVAALSPSVAPSAVPSVALPGDGPPAPAGGLRITNAPPPGRAGDIRGLEFRCAEPPMGSDVLPIATPATTGTTQDGDPIYYGCPIRLYDTTWTLGNTRLAVNHQDHREAVFFALHGSSASDGASSRSRTGLTHVSFTTAEQGLDWHDQPIDPAETNGTLGAAYGDDASGVMDLAGNMYAAFLWNLPHGAGWDPVIGLYKGPTTREQGGMLRAYESGHFLLARDQGNTIQELHAVHVPSAVPRGEEGAELAMDNHTATTGNATGNSTAPQGNATTQPSTEADNGEWAAPGNITEERVFVLWHEAANDTVSPTTGMSAWIDAAWTDTGYMNNWTRMAEDQLIGPCRDFSNAVAWGGDVYVACVVDRGYDDRPRARVGHVDLWKIDAATGNSSVVSTTRLYGGKPVLAVNEDGYMAIAVYTRQERPDGGLSHLRVEAAFGWYGRNWELFGDLGPDLRRMAGGSNVPLRDAHVTALVLTSDEPTALIVYKEWHDDPQDPQGIDPDDPAAFIGDQLTDYNKYIVSFNACEFPLAAAQMELGTAVDANNAEQYQYEPGVFNDLWDGLFVTREPSGEELVYFAISDYGAMQYGAVVAQSAAGFCAIPPPPPILPVMAVPQALTVSSPYTAAVGAALALPAIAMVTYLLTVKRRVAHFVTAEDE